jgi:hypothetical protein
VAVSAQSNKILLEVIPGSAAEFFVMDLEIRETAAELASPPVPLQDF